MLPDQGSAFFLGMGMAIIFLDPRKWRCPFWSVQDFKSSHLSKRSPVWKPRMVIILRRRGTSNVWLLWKLHSRTITEAAEWQSWPLLPLVLALVPKWNIFMNFPMEVAFKWAKLVCSFNQNKLPGLAPGYLLMTPRIVKSGTERIAQSQQNFFF